MAPGPSTPTDVMTWNGRQRHTPTSTLHTRHMYIRKLTENPQKPTNIIYLEHFLNRVLMWNRDSETSSISPFFSQSFVNKVDWQF